MRDSSTLQSASLGYGGQMDRSTGRFLPAAMILALLVQLMGVLPLPAFNSPVDFPVTPAAVADDASAGGYELPSLFEANRGQLPAGVDFAMRSGDFSVQLRDNGATFDTPLGDVDMNLVGAGPETSVVGVEPLPTEINYLIGPRAEWTTNVPTFRSARYENVYPGISAIFHARATDFQYDFEIAPAADPSQIGIRIDGADATRIAGNGDLLLKLNGGGELRHARPYAYQLVDSEIVEVPSAFTLTGNLLGFVLGDYDADLPLVIDPDITYSTYLGGSREERLSGFEVDELGNAYIYGNTDSSDKEDDDLTVCDDEEDPVPTTDGAFQEEDPGDDQNDSQCKDNNDDGSDENTFVAKFDPDGDAVFVTYLGGFQNDEAPSEPGRDLLGVDVTGQAVVAGTTSSVDFPTSNAFDDTCDDCSNSGTSNDGDAFVTKFTADGSDVIYSTFLGGEVAGGGAFAPDEGAFGVDVDVTGTAYIVGQTSSSDFPTANAQQPTYGGGQDDMFVAKLNPNGSANFLTYLGGTSDEHGMDISTDNSGNTFITGKVRSTDFPLDDAYDATHGGDLYAGVLTAYDANGNFMYSTYLSGASCPQADCDSKGMFVEALTSTAWVGGVTRQSDFPVTGGATGDVFDDTCGAGTPIDPDQGSPGNSQPDVFVGEFGPSGAPDFLTCYGGDNFEELEGLAVNVTGHAYIAGWTLSDPTGTASAEDFPLVNAWDSDPSIDTSDGAGVGQMAPEAFMAGFANDGESLDFSTYLGGMGPDLGRGIAVGGDGNIYSTGVTVPRNPAFFDGEWETGDFETDDSDFPTTEDSCDPGDEGDAFVTGLRPNGDIVYSTFLGGDGPQEGRYIGSDGEDVVVAGAAGPSATLAPADEWRGDPQDNNARNFPLVNAYDDELEETFAISDDDDDRQDDEAFVTRFEPGECSVGGGGGGGGSSPDLDVSPESSQNELPDDDEHTLDVSVSGFSDDPVDFKIVAGPNDNTAGVDFSCDPDENGNCSVSYSSGGQTGMDQICAWIDADNDNEYDVNGTDQDGGDCEEEPQAEIESNDATDVVFKNWIGTDAPNPRCSDNEDNDGDGLVDSADPGCTGPDDNSEGDPPKSQCSDGVDNDRDGDVDGADRNCAGPNDDSEGPRRSPPARRCDIDKFPNHNVILGTDGPDTLRGTSGPDLICANSGRDNVFGKAGADVIFLGSGADEVLAGKGADLVRGGGGRDDIEGDKGKDELHGGDMGDVIRGDEGGDSLWGHNGNDRLKGGPGNDDLHGGAGNFDECTGGDGSDTQQGCEASP